MLSPKKLKHRKQMKMSSHLRGVETRGCSIAFGDFALRAMESAWITARQIEACRIAASRHTKRGGKLWIKVFPDKPLTKKPAETRMGNGKGAPEAWVATVRAGRILLEITGVPLEVAKRALTLAGAKLPVKCQFVERKDTLL